MKLVIAKSKTIDDKQILFKEFSCPINNKLSITTSPNKQISEDNFFFLSEFQTQNILELSASRGESSAQLIIRYSNKLLKEHFQQSDWNIITLQTIELANAKTCFTMWDFGHWNKNDEIDESCKAVIPPLLKNSQLSIALFLWANQLGIGIFTASNSRLLDILMPNLKEALQNVPDIYEDSENSLHSL